MGRGGGERRDPQGPAEKGGTSLQNAGLKLLLKEQLGNREAQRQVRETIEKGLVYYAVVEDNIEEGGAQLWKTTKDTLNKEFVLYPVATRIQLRILKGRGEG